MLIQTLLANLFGRCSCWAGVRAFGPPPRDTLSLTSPAEAKRPVWWGRLVDPPRSQTPLRGGLHGKKLRTGIIRVATFFKLPPERGNPRQNPLSVDVVWFSLRKGGIENYITSCKTTRRRPPPGRISIIDKYFATSTTRANFKIVRDGAKEAHRPHESKIQVQFQFPRLRWEVLHTDGRT